ncbi:glutaminyl-peptide cyclotransferase isoform X1 [Hemibagrus wyckioides]|uniref:glutaminyl-peptide cyclotransferase isoform X1 n=1 Tax=Hemibagrus wyckioides TaxID=337641 RepID=UPI00266D7E7F|nr:glutaminyl-peptide cyclotransferase isoform X1 [Hemibagrus wyckioides]
MKRRRSKSTQLSCVFGLCSQPPICRMRMLLLCLCVLLAVTLSLGLMLSDHETRRSEDFVVRVPDLKKDKLTHRPSKPTAAQVKRLVSEVNWARLWYAHLQPILIERHPGSRGSRTVRRHISSVLDSLSAGWSVQIDSFNSETPRGPINFSNILAVLDPMAPRRLLLACHYDTKNIPLGNHELKKVFVGASDSAVPCAMMLELVTALDSHLKMLKQQMAQVTLQLVFFDGAEAFEEWTASDSLYGSRHLAEHMSRTPHPPGSEHTNLLHALDLFILLALIGAPSPTFVNHFQNSARWFDRLVLAEKRLHNLGLLSSHPTEQTYFRSDITVGPVDDDHKPFLQQGENKKFSQNQWTLNILLFQGCFFWLIVGVPVLHVIATPFPPYRHTVEDNADKVHSDTVENLTKVLVVFLAEYLRL